MVKQIITITGPSLSGKTQFTKKFSELFDCNIVISSTTRDKRLNEIDKIDYNFISIDDFKKNKFVQTTFFNNHYYGVSEKEVKQKLNKPLLWVIAPESIEQVEKYCNENNICLTKVFITNPKDVIFYRLFDRFKNDKDSKIETYVNRLNSILSTEDKWLDQAVKNEIKYDLIFKEFNNKNYKDVLNSVYNKIISNNKVDNNKIKL